jgi:hypothetical protein
MSVIGVFDFVWLVQQLLGELSMYNRLLGKNRA